MMATTTDNDTHTSKSLVHFQQNMKFKTIRYTSLSHHVIKEDGVYDCDISATPSQLSGWGSAMSRKSYPCLPSLVKEISSPTRKIMSDPIDGEEWGYFVDTI